MDMNVGSLDDRDPGGDPLGLAFARGRTDAPRTLKVVRGGAASPFEIEGYAAFAAGTRIATRSGETPVEQLRLGDMVSTLGGPAPAIWIGRRRIDLARSPAAAPILIRAGAFADGVPRRDLLVSPDHGLFLDGGIVAARLLLNGGSVVLAPVHGPVDYLHVELPAHAILLAEGTPCESWQDTGTRALFENAFAPGWSDLAGCRVATDAPCAPLVEGGAALDAVRARLDGRARLASRSTGADLVMTVAAAGRHRATVPPGAAGMVIVSRAGPGTGDERRLGVAVTALVLDGTPVALDERTAVSGFHALESNEDGIWRWTDGRARIAFAPAARSRLLELWVHHVRVPTPE